MSVHDLKAVQRRMDANPVNPATTPPRSAAPSLRNMAHTARSAQKALANEWITKLKAQVESPDDNAA